jgi:predicted Zn-dependent peptidase
MSTAVILPEVDLTATPSVTTATQETRNIRRTVLSNGLLVLTESMPHLRSVSMGVWLGAGSRDEAAEINGISHFVEHMVFKGSATRSAQQIAREVDSIGGNLDAFTGKETICFNIKVLDEHVPAALDVLSDLVLNPIFDAEDLTREQGVILEEIKMDEDNPDYLVHEIFTQGFYKNQPLGRPILGTAKTVSSFTRETAQTFHDSRFTPRHMIFSAAGNLDHDAFIAQVEQRFGGLAATTAPETGVSQKPKTFAKITLRKKRSLEQAQLCLGVPAPPVASADRFSVYILNSILGGGMSSRLFQTIREERGLAYSIYSEMNPFRDTGTLCVYAGCAAEKAEEVIRLTMAEFARLKNEPVSAEELQRAKDQMKGNIVLGLESSSSRMSNLARQQSYFGRFFGVDEVTTKIDSVTRESVQAIAQRLLQSDAVGLTLLGNLGQLKITRDHLGC